MNNIIKLPVHNGVIVKFLRYSKQIHHKYTLSKFRSDFYSDPKNELAQNACTRFDPFEVAISRKKTETTLHVYNIKIPNKGLWSKLQQNACKTKSLKVREAKEEIDSEAKPVTNQENSGRCWLFAALNVMRLPFMKKYGIEEFEFSQSEGRYLAGCPTTASNEDKPRYLQK
ncbi:hypothetical protein HF086_012150 [Spodoptera exigua]|uniref:Bleomycin hydrolase n=1 Tax=Spodoptera exigua TaxID=7107 RepID=A0A922M6Q2_SPOEX|nr:hypothetical protein HF086_012150 [Spodoptera exigua]